MVETNAVANLILSQLPVIVEVTVIVPAPTAVIVEFAAVVALTLIGAALSLTLVESAVNVAVPEVDPITSLTLTQAELVVADAEVDPSPLAVMFAEARKVLVGLDVALSSRTRVAWIVPIAVAYPVAAKLILA